MKCIFSVESAVPAETTSIYFVLERTILSRRTLRTKDHYKSTSIFNTLPNVWCQLQMGTRLSIHAMQPTGLCISNTCREKRNIFTCLYSFVVRMHLASQWRGESQRNAEDRRGEERRRVGKSLPKMIDEEWKAQPKAKEQLDANSEGMVQRICVRPILFLRKLNYTTIHLPDDQISA